MGMALPAQYCGWRRTRLQRNLLSNFDLRGLSMTLYHLEGRHPSARWCSGTCGTSLNELGHQVKPSFLLLYIAVLGVNLRRDGLSGTPDNLGE